MNDESHRPPTVIVAKARQTKEFCPILEKKIYVSFKFNENSDLSFS